MGTGPDFGVLLYTHSKMVGLLRVWQAPLQACWARIEPTTGCSLLTCMHALRAQTSSNTNRLRVDIPRTAAQHKH